MSEAQAKFSVVLDDKTSGPAETASRALEKLRGSIQGDKAALAAMQAAMKQLQSGTNVNIAAFRELQGKIEAQKSKVAEATAKYVELGGTFHKTRPAAARARSGLDELAESASRLPGPLGGLGARLTSIKGLLGGGMALGLAAVAAALIAVGAAAVVAAAGLARYGLAAGNARRSERLHLEGIQNMRSAYIRHRASAGEVQAAIDRVAGSSASSRTSIASFAEVLHRGGLRGSALTTALNAAATKAAVLGDESGRAFASFAVGAHRSGVGIERLARDVDARFGRAARGMLLDLDVMSTKLSESWNALFNGVDFEPVLKMFHEVTQLFSQNTASGRALKSVVTAIFGPMASSAEGATPIVKRFFQGMVIAALQVSIAVLTVRNWLRRTFRDSSFLSGIDGMTIALNAGKVAFFGLAAAAGLALLAVGGLVLTAAALAAPFVLGAIAIVKLAGAIRNVAGQVVSTWREIGPRLVDGLVSGIRGAAGRALSAVRDLGGGLADALKEALDIRSPSRVFAGLGVQIPRGVEVGIESGAPGLNRAVAGMVEIPDPTAGGVGATSSSSSTSTTVQLLGDIHIHAPAADGPTLAASFRDQLANALEGLGVQIGAPV